LYDADEANVSAIGAICFSPGGLTARRAAASPTSSPRRYNKFEFHLCHLRDWSRSSPQHRSVRGRRPHHHLHARSHDRNDHYGRGAVAAPLPRSSSAV